MSNTNRAKDYRFEIRDLPGWEVFMQSDRFGTRWCFQAPADFPQSFAWSDEAEDHVVPIFRDWPGPFVGAECRTAGAAVAAAHRHHDHILAHMKERGVAA